jgi:hypothetical protein
LEHVAPLLIYQAATNVLRLAVGASWNGTRCSTAERMNQGLKQMRRRLDAA